MLLIHVSSRIFLLLVWWNFLSFLNKSWFTLCLILFLTGILLLSAYLFSRSTITFNLLSFLCINHMDNFCWEKYVLCRGSFLFVKKIWQNENRKKVSSKQIIWLSYVLQLKQKKEIWRKKYGTTTYSPIHYL